MRKRLFLPLGLLALAGLFTACSGKRDDSVIRVGEFSSLTGSEATFGISTHEALILAIDQANAAGGVNGKKLQLITLDNQGKPDETVVAVTRLINQDKVHAIIGEVASSRSLAAAPICQAAKVPMISPASTNVAVTEKGDYIFRACFIDPFQGKVMADYAFNALKLRRAAILRDLKSDYSMGLSDVFKARFTQLGGQVVAEDSYSGGDMDFKAQLTNIRAKAPQIIYCPGYYTEVGLIAKQARALGVNEPLAGGDGYDSPKLAEIAGAAALEGYYYSNHYTPESDDPRVQGFVKQYVERWHHVPDALAALGYDAGGMLVEALKRSKSLNGPDLRDAIAATKAYPGVTGDITLDEHRNPSKSAVVLKITGGKARFVATVKP